MSYTELADAFAQQRKLNPNAQYVRLTCEQVELLRHEFGQNRIYAWDSLPVVTRGSIRDCNFREARPRIACIDLTKVEP